MSIPVVPRRTVAPWSACLTLVIVAACGGPPEPEITPTTLGADRLLYERGTAALEEGDWARAREYFVQLRDGYPQSALRADARLAVADTFEAEGTLESSVQALTSYQEFLSLYPTHERAAHAQFRLGMVHFNQMRSPDRDQTDTRDAIAEFEAFIQRYPNSELMPEVREHLRLARDRLSEAELLVGRYYFGRKWWPGAIDRLRAVLEEDPGFSRRDSIYFYLGDALSRVGRAQEVEEGIGYLERLENDFPESEHLEEGREALATARMILAELHAAVAAATAAAEDEESTNDAASQGGEDGPSD